MDLYTLEAWLIRDGRVIRGPVPVSAGGPGTETPIGKFSVLWKSELHRSVECKGTPMPFSVFFTVDGVAFHHGTLARPSIGCVKLGAEDAKAWYEALDVGDEVWVGGSDDPSERACRIGLKPGIDLKKIMRFWPTKTVARIRRGRGTT